MVVSAGCGHQKWRVVSRGTACERLIAPEVGRTTRAENVPVASTCRRGNVALSTRGARGENLQRFQLINIGCISMSVKVVGGKCASFEWHRAVAFFPKNCWKPSAALHRCKQHRDMLSGGKKRNDQTHLKRKQLSLPIVNCQLLASQ